jgi:hypothetical protein
MTKGKAAARKPKLLNPSTLPGTFASRVFIGGSYDTTAGVTGNYPAVLDRRDM